MTIPLLAITAVIQGLLIWWLAARTAAQRARSDRIIAGNAARHEELAKRIDAVREAQEMLRASTELRWVRENSSRINCGLQSLADFFSNRPDGAGQIPAMLEQLNRIGGELEELTGVVRIRTNQLINLQASDRLIRTEIAAIQGRLAAIERCREGMIAALGPQAAGVAIGISNGGQKRTPGGIAVCGIGIDPNRPPAELNDK